MNPKSIEETSILIQMLAIIINVLSNIIKTTLHRMFATFHHNIVEYGNEKSNIICWRRNCSVADITFIYTSFTYYIFLSVNRNYVKNRMS